MTPRVSLVAFRDRDPAFIFVAVPNERGRYVRTDKSVIKVSCSLCNAMVGEPCRAAYFSKDIHYAGATHYVRRKKARGIRVPEYDELHRPDFEKSAEQVDYAIQFLRKHYAWLEANWAKDPDGREYISKFSEHLALLEIKHAKFRNVQGNHHQARNEDGDGTPAMAAGSDE
jgi:hypothetical protein